MPRTAFVYHPFCEKHDMGPEHPENPARVAAIKRHFENIGLSKELEQVIPEAAYEDAILRVHHPKYVEQLEMISPSKGLVQADPDTMMGPHSYTAAYLAAGAGITAVDDIMAGEYQNAFCCVRPPGHHAEPGTTMGFCFFNNIAIAVQHLRSQYDIKKVAVIDFDVHQGNGTIEIFQKIPSVLFCSSFQHPLYPNTHIHSPGPNIINSPLDAYGTGTELMQVWEQQWTNALEAHQPEFIFISAGFDAHRDDPLGEMNWVSQDYYWLTRRICDLAERLCEGRVVSMLEGGYDLKSLVVCAEKHVQGLLGL